MSVSACHSIGRTVGSDSVLLEFITRRLKGTVNCLTDSQLAKVNSRYKHTIRIGSMEGVCLYSDHMSKTNPVM